MAGDLEYPTFSEKWEISTGVTMTSTKRGCLSEVGPGANNSTLIGDFDLSFGYPPGLSRRQES